MKKPSILIITGPEDTHAIAVAEGLRRKGVEPTIWMSTDYPSRAHETISFDGVRCNFDINGVGGRFAQEPFDTVWHRRPAFVVDGQLLDPADQAYADVECRMFREAMLNMLAADAFWVNRRDASRRARLKPWQHGQAVAVGLTVPDTRYTNDPVVIREFIRAQGGVVAFKPLLGQLWESANAIISPYTTLLTERQLIDDALLRQVPAIYQALVPKAFELRVTVMGQHVFAAQILSQETESGRTDWRMAHDEVEMRPYQLSDSLRGQCLALLDRLGLAFGCLDFIVTPDGDTVFLEVNQMGQFLFLDYFAEMPLLDAFCELLIQGRPDFEWSEDSVTVEYGELTTCILLAMERAQRRHVAAPSGTIRE